MRPPPTGTPRVYSTTHRAMQRLREQMPEIAMWSDEDLRDRISWYVHDAEKRGLATETTDAKLNEPQIIVELDQFKERAYAIVKDNTVVTVLSATHGADVLARAKNPGGELVSRVRSASGPAGTDSPERIARLSGGERLEVEQGSELYAAIRADLADTMREAAVHALAQAIREYGDDEPLSAVWSTLAEHRAPDVLSWGDLRRAFVSAAKGA